MRQAIRIASHNSLHSNRQPKVGDKLNGERRIMFGFISPISLPKRTSFPRSRVIDDWRDANSSWNRVACRKHTFLNRIMTLSWVLDRCAPFRTSTTSYSVGLYAKRPALVCCNSPALRSQGHDSVDSGEICASARAVGLL